MSPTKLLSIVDDGSLEPLLRPIAEQRGLEVEVLPAGLGAEVLAALVAGDVVTASPGTVGVELAALDAAALNLWPRPQTSLVLADGATLLGALEAAGFPIAPALAQTPGALGTSIARRPDGEVATLTHVHRDTQGRWLRGPGGCDRTELDHAARLAKAIADGIDLCGALTVITGLKGCEVAVGAVVAFPDLGVLAPDPEWLEELADAHLACIAGLDRLAGCESGAW